MKIKKYLFAVLVCILGLLLPMSVDASEKKDGYGLTLQCEVPGTEISLYQLTAGIERSSCRLIAPFEKYQTKIKGLDELETLDGEGFRTLAVTLEETVAADQIKSLSTQKVDEKGQAVWENLNKGLYLILGSETKDKKYIYTPSPMLIAIPNQTETGALEKHPVLKYNKFEKEPIKETKKLEEGAEVCFIDAEGNIFTYTLAWTEIIDQYDIHKMLSKKEDWDLTLFTCTYGGEDRYTFRFRRSI